MKRLSLRNLSDCQKKKRKEKGISLEELGQKTGINRVQLGKLEKGEYTPSIKQLEKISEVLDIDILSLYEEDEEKKVFTSFRGHLTQEEEESYEYLLNMMLIAKQQIVFDKAVKR